MLYYNLTSAFAAAIVYSDHREINVLAEWMSWKV